MKDYNLLELQEKQIKHFECYMKEKEIEIGYKKCYPPYSFEDETKEMTVIDTDIGIFAVDKNFKIIKIGSRHTDDGIDN